MSDQPLPIEVRVHTTTAMDTRRNRWAGRVANWALSFATPEYRKFVGGAILYGMNAAARDVVEDDDPPPAWFACAKHDPVYDRTVYECGHAHGYCRRCGETTEPCP